MCAISGLLSLGENPVDIEALRRMSATMRHRGPDGRGAVSFGRCGLAHERLAIVDLETGSQPLLSEDGRTAAVVNGEIYNHADLRAALQLRGHRFSTQSDSEVVVHGFEEFGCGIFERLHGMFAIALWDDARRTLVLARDGLGKKPLCFTWLDRGRLAFASELRAFHAHADFRPQLRRSALAEYLGYRCVEDPGSIYENVNKVPAGEWLAIEPDGAVRRGVHWSLPTIEPLAPYDRRREAEMARELRERVGRAVRRRLMSDVPVGILLSGGIDSTVVAYEAARQCPAIRTFTLGFAGADDECDIARATAQALGTQHTEHRIDLDPTAAMTAAEAAYDEPFADSSAVASVRICEAARQHVSVVLNGDGGDEAFAGYARAQLLARRWRDVPPWLLRHLLKFRLKVGTDRSRGRALDHQRIRKAMREHSGDFERWRALLWVFSPAEVGRMTGSPAALEGPSRCTFAQTEADDYRFYLRSDLLVKMDRASMHVGLEARSPLLDTDVIGLSRGLDVGWKLRGATTKYLLRRAYRDLLPSHIWSLRKRGFAAPTKKWLATALRQEVSELARDRAQPVYAVLDFAAVQDATQHMQGYHQKVWSVLMLNRWLAREAARVRA